MRRKISAHVDGGPSGGSSVRRPGSEDPHRRERKFSKHFSPVAAVSFSKVEINQRANLNFPLSCPQKLQMLLLEIACLSWG